MQILQQLQNATYQAYENFKSNANNVAQVNAAYASVIAAAQQASQTGLYDVSVNLPLNTSNPVLFQRYLNELLTDQGFEVIFSASVQQTLVSVSWDPDVLNG